MTHLVLNQSLNITENVSSAVIDKLYELAKTSDVEDLNNSVSMSLRGNITPSAAFEDAVSFLKDKFENLIINEPSGGYYIRFKDEEVKRVCIEKWGNGAEGITSRTLANVTSAQFGTTFTNNTTIENFEDLKYFTSVKSLVGGAFQGCSNLETIDLSNITSIGSQIIRNSGIKVIDFPNLETMDFNSTCLGFARSLEEVKSLGIVTQLGGFNGDIKLRKIVLPETVTRITDNAFRGCDALEEVGPFTNVEEVGNELFRDTAGPLSFVYFPNLIKTSHTFLRNCNIRHVYLPKIKNTYVGYYAGPTVNSSFWTLNGFFVNNESPIHVFYLRDIETFGACTFYGVNITNLVINQVTPPTIAPNSNTNITLVNQNTDIFFAAESDNQILAKVTNIYVPDSAVNAYKAAPGFENVTDRIKPLSEINKVATKAAFDNLSATDKINTVVEEYM